MAKQIKCTARIYKEYKKAKAKCVWPEFAPSGVWIPNPVADEYPEECGGEVRLKAYAQLGMYYGDVELEVTETCSRCSNPFYKGKKAINASSYMGELDLNELINEIY
jgi:hypothetical protein